jgi:serine protease
LIVNGGFEGSASPWILSGPVNWSNGPNPHSGTGYLSLANVNNAKGAAYQQIAVPNGTAPGLTFWLNVTSADTTSVANDVLFVEIRNTAGTLLQTLATYSNLDRGTAGVYVQRGAFSLGAYAGQTIRVQFRASTNASLITTFLLDDVSVR